MSKGFRIYIISYILIVFGLGLAAQNYEDGTVAQHGRSGHKITLVMANSFINNSFSDQTNGILIVPTFGFNYDYFINGKWGLGLHTDILVQHYKIEKHGSHEEIVRENPVAICGMALFKPHHRWTLMGGYGFGVVFSKMLGRKNETIT